MKIGENIRRLRIEKGYTQQYMATILDMSDNTFRNIENNKSSPTIEILNKIAAIFEIGLSDIILYEKKFINQDNCQKCAINTVVLTNKRLMEQFNQSYKEQIELLKKEIELLKNQLQD